MAFRVSPGVALLIVFSLMAVAHCAPLEAKLATTTTAASSAAVAAAEVVEAVSEGEELPLPLPYSEENVVSDALSGDEEVPREEDEEAVEPVAEPDPDRSHPNSDGEEELTAKEQIDADEEEDEEEEKKVRKNHGGDKEEKKKRKKRHDCDGKDKKEKKTKTKRHQSNDDEEEEEEEEMKKKIHRHHHVERKKTKKLTHRNSDEQEKEEKRWRKAISRSMFGHGRRSQREEAAKDEVNN